MKPTAFIAAGVLLALLGGATAKAEDSRAASAIEAVRRVEPAPPLPVRPAKPKSWQRLDPVACAELCRLFEWLGSLERRAPGAPAPTS